MSTNVYYIESLPWEKSCTDKQTDEHTNKDEQMDKQYE